MEALRFNLDQDNRPLKETITLSTLEKSPFKDQYQKAFSEIEYYLDSLKDDTVEKDMDYANNIFVFSGDRGSGKTSCMVSVGGFLTKKRELRSEFKEKYPKISDKNFFSLDLMDPTYFDTKHNILSLFLAKLYGAFQRLTSHTDVNIKESKKMDFLASLSKAQKHSRLLLDNEKDVLITNKVEELECLAVAVELKEDIRILVQDFLDCLNSEYQILLLRIDDVDLNAQEAGVMSELIRKYFILPNVMVLMALKMDQLDIIKRNEYSKSFRLGNEDNQVIEMAERYLTKLFPHSHRIYMPDIEDFLNRKLIICSQSKEYVFPSVQQCVPELIFKKTRYLFYNSPVHASYIVPRNFRDLRQLIALLWNMEDYSENIDDHFHLSKKGKYNQAVFKKYLSEVWINNNLEIKCHDFARSILSMDELMRLNTFVVRELGKDHNFPNNPIIGLYANDDNTVYNISLGDVLGLIEYLYRKTNDTGKHRFLFFIKTVYSIRMYEAYNKKTESKIVPSIAQTQQEDVVTTNPEVLRKSQYNSIEDYDKIVSGYLVNVQQLPLLPPDMGLDNRYLMIEHLNELMQFCATNFELAANSNHVRLLEFFMLSVSHPKSFDPDYRKQDSVAYDAHISMQENLTFDLGAFFFNLTRIKHCYQRFMGNARMPDGQDLIDRILASKRSLYHDFMEMTRKKYQCPYRCPYGSECTSKENGCTYYDSRWLSFCSFRNIEILQDFIKYVQTKDVDRKKLDRTLLASFFEKCAEYTIRTYNKEVTENGEQYKTIQFSFLSKVAELLHDTNLDGRFMPIFGENPHPAKAGPVEQKF